MRKLSSVLLALFAVVSVFAYKPAVKAFKQITAPKTQAAQPATLIAGKPVKAPNPKGIKQTNAITTFPYTEGFEATDGGWTTGAQTAVASTWAWGTPAKTGRVGTYASTMPGAATGTKCWTTGLTAGYNNLERSWLKSPEFDFTNLASPVFQAALYWDFEGTATFYEEAILQYTTDNGTSWTTVGSTVNDPDGQNWYNVSDVVAARWTDYTVTPTPTAVWAGPNYLNPATFTGTTPLPVGVDRGWVTAKYTIPALTGKPSVYFRFAFSSDVSVNTYSGMGVDDIRITEAPSTDANITAITSPTSGCGNTATSAVTISVRNRGSAAIANLPVFYVINNGTPVAGTIPALAAGATISYTFPTTANLATAGNYSFVVYAAAPGESDVTNDTVKAVITTVPSVVTFPYSEGFEIGDGGWLAGGTNSSWAYGTPSKTQMASAGNGAGSWVTNLSGNYNNNEKSWVSSPCFNFSTLSDPVFQALLFYDTQAATDGLILQATTNGGTTWTTVGTVNEPVNWYNTAAVSSFSSFPGMTAASVGWAGLNNSTRNWVTVRHKLLGLGGQSSVTLRFAFSSSAATVYEGVGFDDILVYENDPVEIAVDSVLTPLGGCSFTAATPITIRVKNNGSQVATNVPVSYTLNNGMPVTGTVPGPIPVNGRVTYTFPTGANLATAGIYTLAIRASATGDANPTNDTLSRTINVIPLITTYPYSEGFETTNGGWSTGSATTVASSWAWGTPSKTAITAAGAGTKSWVSGLTAVYNNYEKSYLISPCFNFSTLTDPVFEAKIIWDFENIGTTYYDGTALQYSTNNGTTWVPVGAVNDGNNWYDRTTISSFSPEVGYATTAAKNAWGGRDAGRGWVTAKHKLTGLAGQSSVRLRFVLSSDVTGAYDGFGVDDILIQDTPANDIGVDSVLAPVSGCGLTASTPVTVRVRNYGSATQTSFPVNFRVDNGTPVTETATATLAPNSTVLYTFTTGANLVTPGNHTVTAYSSLTGDATPANNTASKTVTTIPTINVYPYFQGFETNEGSWTTGTVGTTVASSWAWGTPAKTILTTAATGTKAWVTNLTGNYNASEKSYLMGPCFDFSALSEPIFEAKIFWDAEGAGTNFYDGAALQASTNNGVTWVAVGAVNDGNNWYDRATISSFNAALGYATAPKNGWGGRDNASGTPRGWVTAKHRLTGLGGKSSVKIRIIFSSDGGTNYEGFAIDDIGIYNLPAKDLAVTAITAPTGYSCSNNGGAPVTIKIKNNGSDTAFAGTYSATYKIDGNGFYNTATENVNVKLAPSAETTYTFSANATLPATAGVYKVHAFTTIASDAIPGNDSLAGGISFEVLPKSFSNVQVNTFTTNISEVITGWKEAKGYNPTIINSTWTTPTAAQTTALGEYTARVTVNLADKREWIITQPVNLTATQGIRFKYAVTAVSGVGVATLGADDSLKIKVSTDCGTTWKTAGFINTASAYTNRLQETTVALNTTGSDVLIAFYATSGTVASAQTSDIHINMFSIVNVLANDAAALAVLKPSPTCGSGPTDSVKVTFRNNGVQAIAKLPVAYSVNGSRTLGNNYAIDTLRNLAPFAVRTFTFPTLATLTGNNGKYTLKAFTMLPGDLDHTNDTVVGDISRNSIPLTMPFTSFDGVNLTTLFPGWREGAGATAAGTSSNWNGLQQSGNSVALMSYAGSGVQNEWVVGPSIITDSSSYLKVIGGNTWRHSVYPVLTYQLAGRITGGSSVSQFQTNQHLYIKYSTDCGTTWATIKDLTAANTQLNSLLTTYTQRFTGFYGLNMILGFQATDAANGQLGFDLYLDNISVTMAHDSVLLVNTRARQLSNGFSLYPNPNNGSFKLAFDNKQLTGNVDIAVTDVTGRVVYATKANTANTEMVINTGALPGGTYIIKVGNADAVTVKRFVIFDNK